MKIRKPVVAGQFYPQQEDRLKAYLSQVIEERKREKVKGAVVPHAGYIYSGRVAASVYSSILIPDTVILLGPNHTGRGALFSLMREGIWSTPLGNIPIHREMANHILSLSSNLEEDEEAHLLEHSLEVQLPFLKYLNPQVKIVPIILSPSTYPVYEEIGNALAQAIQERKEETLILASSDFTHYQPQEIAEKNDKLAIEAILKLDGKILLERVEKYRITMCGYAPTVVMLVASCKLNARQGILIEYTTSGEVTGDYQEVVGYAGIIIK